MKNTTPAYYLCSKSVIEHFPTVEQSRPFKSGYGFDHGDDYYIAILDFDVISEYYKNVIAVYNEKSNVDDIDFWCRECCPGSMDVSKITLKDIKSKGLFVEIEHNLSLTNESNRAMCIYNLSEKFNCTPIEFINKIAKG